MPDDNENEATSAGKAPSDETEIVTVDYPPTGSSDTLEAWSREEPEPELDGPWRRAFQRAALPLFIVAAVAFGVAVIASLLIETHHEDKPPPAAKPMPAAALPPISGGPVARDPHDDEFVAMALSPKALVTPGQVSGAGFGTSGTQGNADKIALNECKAASGNDDCMLINGGIFHGCVSYAIDDGDKLHWASGVGPDVESAKAAAVNRLGAPAFFVTAQCSDPPGILKPSLTPRAAPLPSLPEPSTAGQPTPNAGDPAKDAQFIAALKRVNINVISAPQALATAHYVCGQLGRGAAQSDMIEFIKTHGDVTDIGAIDFVADAVAFYCPQYGG